MAARDLRRQARLAEFIESVTTGMGREERREALGSYLRALLMSGERKNIQALALRIAKKPRDAEAHRQRMQQAVVVAKWDEQETYRRICSRVLGAVPEVEALVFDDTGFPKKGPWSPGVQRQYSGTLGRVDNCQVAVSLHVATDIFSACIGMRLFLPESWEGDELRRKRAGIPEDVHHLEKWRLALGMLDERKEWGLDGKIVLADSGYGDCREFRLGLEDRGFEYVVGISSTVKVWADGRLPASPEQRRRAKGPGRGPPITTWGRDLQAETVRAVALRAVDDEWTEYSWRNGEDGREREGRFLAKRVRHAHRVAHGTAPGNEQWLLIQWNGDQDEPSNYWLSNLPPSELIGRLVYLAKLRWRVERDYQDMKGQLGLDHFEGRTWSGFHHHCALVAAAHAFLAIEKALFPPGEDLLAGLSSTPASSPPP